jgi:hypothetical protein
MTDTIRLSSQPQQAGQQQHMELPRTRFRKRACIVAATVLASVKDTYIPLSPIVVNHQLLRVLLDFALVYN